jgi:ABC-type transport system involved in multi-copper enzyme maturation permease subunit
VIRNPVLTRELTQRVRSRRWAITISLYLLVLAAILKLTADGIARVSNAMQCVGSGVCFRAFGALAGTGAGRTMFQVLLAVVLFMLCLLLPGVTAGAIAGERARQTLVPLQLTLLSPMQILLGKLFASTAFVLLLIVATLPVFTAPFWLGGVSVADVVKAFAMLILIAVALACVGLLFSTVLRRITGAIVVTYAIVFVLLFGTTVAYFAQYTFVASSTPMRAQRPPALVLAPNPFVAMAAVVGSTNATGANPFDGIARVFGDTRNRGRVGAPGVPASGTDGWFWTLSVWSYAVIIALCLWLAARRLRVPSGAPA